MTVSVWTPTLEVEVDSLPVTGVLGGRVTRSAGDPVGKCYVSFAVEPSWAKGDVLEVTAGGGYNHLQRFYGTVVGGEKANSDGSFQLTAYGPLWQLSKYYNPNLAGLTLAQIVSNTATDQQITQAVLDEVGATNIGTILGTSIVRGALAPSAFAWRSGTNALSYLRELDRGSLGYQLVEEGANISRRFLSRRPAVSPAKMFTEGVNIFAGARTSRSDLDRFNAFSVTGYNYGGVGGAVSAVFPDPPGTVAIRTFQSDMIERALNADPGTGLSAEAQLAFLIAEEDHDRVVVRSLSTPRDEAVSIGETHLVAALPFLGVNENVCVTSVTIEFSPQWFTQTFDYEGGT